MASRPLPACVVRGAGHRARHLADSRALRALWLRSPAVARWISLPPARTKPQRSPADDPRACGTARRTWRYFETFVTAADTWLPPDNFQEDPSPLSRIGHRPPISVSICSACRRSRLWLDRHCGAIERLEATLGDHGSHGAASAAISSIGTTRRDLRPLDPEYISAVDSGNLAGHLIALANACSEMAGRSSEIGTWRLGSRISLICFVRRWTELDEGAWAAPLAAFTCGLR